MTPVNGFDILVGTTVTTLKQRKILLVPIGTQSAERSTSSPSFMPGSKSGVTTGCYGELGF